MKVKLTEDEIQAQQLQLEQQGKRVRRLPKLRTVVAMEEWLPYVAPPLVPFLVAQVHERQNHKTTKPLYEIVRSPIFVLMT